MQLSAAVSVLKHASFIPILCSYFYIVVSGFIPFSSVKIIFVQQTCSVLSQPERTALSSKKKSLPALMLCCF